MLSKASQYAIRAVLFLANNSSSKKKYGAKSIAEELEIPIHFIAKILQQLAKAKVISSNKGPNGGFFTSPENLSNNICAVLDELEIGDVFDPCFMGLPECGDENPCPVHHIVSPFKDAILEKFKIQTLAEFSQEILKEGTHLSLKGLFK